MKLSEHIKVRGNLTKLSERTGLALSTLRTLAEYDYNLILRSNYVKISKEKVAYLKDDTK